MNERLEILREELCDLHRENEELKDEVRFLEQELQEANEVLDGIEQILLNELDTETAHMLYNKIFNIK